MDKIIGKVIAINLDTYDVILDSKDEVVSAKLRGNVKKKKNVVVGDKVSIESIGCDYMIDDILPRKNVFLRPPVSNVDSIVIVVAVGSPKPDYILLDKQIILCMSKNITPIICVNKIDLKGEDEEAKKDIEYIKNVYESIGIDVTEVSAKENIGIDKLKEKLKGKISALSGGSGVGKSSITRKLLNLDEDKKIEVGDLSTKSKKGKHTTKYVKLYKVEDDTFILDTPGFSSYDIDIEHKELKKYYNEFNNFKCDYDDCAHVTENSSVCAVKRALDKKLIDSGRYERYVYIYNILKEKYDRRYK